MLNGTFLGLLKSFRKSNLPDSISILLNYGTEVGPSWKYCHSRLNSGQSLTLRRLSQQSQLLQLADLGPLLGDMQGRLLLCWRHRLPVQGREEQRHQVRDGSETKIICNSILQYLNKKGFYKAFLDELVHSEHIDFQDSLKKINHRSLIKCKEVKK